MWYIRHFRCISLLALTLHFACCNVRFESSIEIRGAYASINDGADDQNNGDDGKRCQRLPHRYISCPFGLLIHADEFEKEVSEAGEIERLSQI